ncbi:MAG: silent information regulator protein Sir2 [Bacteroides clarus]|uniref:polysaccharide lyase family 8 super-sandwich domain-containing protein n=1 Tax=Bacteroides clarus TaxID=626929 RepID=UPI00241FFB6C|nr:polysaccharide lyase family 8 super-sandwich domain-containing protein [Bacteroides clarus]MBD9144558.1 silent information regulator protein Sir2 [Bacteroides clarus]
MRNKILFLVIVLLVCPNMLLTAVAQEKVFANYFDIPVNSPEGTEVIGRIHLERNKDVLTSPIPAGYHFEILKQADGLFNLETRYDLSKRIMGVLTVAKGQSTGSAPSNHRLTIALKDGDKQLKKFNINVKVVKETLWSLFNRRYTPKTLENKRLYGRIKYSDDEVAAKIDELKHNGWKFAGLEKCYQGRPQDYVAKFDPTNDHLPTGTIEYDWEKVVNQIGGLGYSYATSKIYGPKGNPEKRKELRETLYQAILTYTNSVPVEGNEVMVDGKPIGNCTGDGFGMLQAHKMAGMQTPTHQWTLTDPLVVPVLHLMPELLKGMRNQDETCLKVHNALIRYLQIFFAEIENRRAIDNPDGRWGELQDTIYSSGAWADANLGHRSRTMLALPIIWADYNRPLTYVQYWYNDFYHDQPFKGFSYSPGWSPHGIVADVSRWMTKYNIVAHKYIQSGFQPDGTVSHHIANATDAAMVAYGFEWLTDCNNGYSYFRNTKFKIGDKYYQFQLDRLLNVYPKLFYKQRMDFLVAGRSFLDDMHRFTTKTYIQAVNSMLNAQNKGSKLNGVEELKDVCKQLKNNMFEYSGTDAYWVNEYLVHRRGENETPFYASLKLKSERTVGAEDFSKKVRRSWHMGYGILQVKVKGDEYSDKVIRNFDWHALPGLTEEWRTDPLPAKGGAQASLPGLNKISGVLADGKAGMGIYHHLPKETYSSATAFKSYHFIEDKIIALGSDIARLRPGQGNEITTFIDQTALNSPLTWCAGEEIQTVEPGQSVNLTQEIKDVCWLHQGSKGYVILPVKQLSLQIKSGKEINITDRTIADKKPNFIIAVSHGVQPGQNRDNAYRYIQLPNVSAEEMPERVEALLQDLEFTMQDGAAHAVYSDTDKTWQYAFFKPGSISVGKTTVTSNDVAQIMLRDNGAEWVLSVNNPMPDGQKQTLTFSTSAKLPAGTYTYQTKGVYPLEGETVTVTSEGKGSKVTVELPDSRDAAKYNYQSDLYAATPIIVNIPKK